MTVFSKTQLSPSSNSDTLTDDLIKVGHWSYLTTTNISPAANNSAQVKQIHGGNIIKAQAYQQAEASADGLIVANDGQKAIIHTADCAPIVITGSNQAIVLHVSRKSIVNGLLDNVMTFLSPKEIDHIRVGPHICEFHFDFSEEDLSVRRFRSRFPQASHFYKGKLYLSLKKAMQYFFEEWQIHPSKISFDGRCTYENLSLPSYRRWHNSGRTGELGRLYTVVWCDKEKTGSL